MASGVKKKIKTLLVKLQSTANTGFFYTIRKNPTKNPKKWVFRKYDPVVRRHVIFEETKLR